MPEAAISSVTPPISLPPYTGRYRMVPRVRGGNALKIAADRQSLTAGHLVGGMLCLVFCYML